MAEPSLYIDQEKSSNGDISLLPRRDQDRKPLPIKMYTEDDEKQAKTKGFLQKRHNDLNSSRPDWKWPLRHKQYRSNLVWRDDGSANTNLPLEGAVIRNKIADEESQKPLVEFIPTTKDDIYKRDLTKKIWNFVWTEADTDQELTKMRYAKNIFGTSIWFEGIHKEIITRFVPEYHKDGKITPKKVTETKSWLKGQMIDIRYVWIDAVPDIEDAVDCFIMEPNVSEDTLEALKHDKNFDKEAIERLIQARGPQKVNESDYTRPFITASESIDSTDGKYTLMHYYNKDKGMYIVTDDKFTEIIREGVNPYPHGELPISILIDHPNYMEMYGIGECELLENTKYERNTIRNQMIDSARMSNTINFAVGAGVSFEGAELQGGVMNIWNFDGNLGDAQFLKPPSQDSMLAAIEEALKGDSTWITGIDVNSLNGSGSKTAFEARLQEQTKLKGIFVSLRQFDYFLVRMARQRLANIQAFLPRTTGKILTDKDLGDKFRTIPIMDSEMEDVMGIGAGGKTEKRSVKFKKKEGAVELLELTPKQIKSNYTISVQTPSTTPILQELDKYDMQEIFTTLMQLAQAPEGAQLLKDFNFLKYYRDVIEQKGFDPDEYINDSAKEQEIKDLRMDVLGDLPAPPQAMNQPTASSLIPNTPPPAPMQQGKPSPEGAATPNLGAMSRTGMPVV